MKYGVLLVPEREWRVSKIKLSICIPTYNRADFLRFLLAQFVAQTVMDFAYEIVISDNASTDNTGAVVEEFIAQGLPIRYFRRDVNGGGWPNLANAYEHAVGEYALYLADDDLLIFESLREAVGYLDGNPDVVVCHAPWFLYDAVDEQDLVQFYTVEGDRKFPRHDFAELLSFITAGHVFPEIAIYRTAALRSLFVPREFCFWAFTFLAHALDIGAVAFLQKPFYRSVTRSPVHRDRPQAGHEEVMTAWDRYRGGIEYFLYIGAKRGRLGMSAAERARYDDLCRQFILIRMCVALRMWVERKEYIKAYELYARIAIAGGSQHPEMLSVRNDLPLMVAVQTLARKVNAASGIDRIVLDKVDDVASLAGLLYELGLEPAVTVVDTPQEHMPETVGRSAVFIADGADRPLFVQKGYAPNLVFSENELVDDVIV